ncbi:SPJ_0845 family protein [Nicoliella lavandulae]|uniref:SPJ_0845 family protein n=1 Tax=Nicoliella lavandulae TaxID=3082954 RepID=A0ABU8SMF8_9LACO
MGLKINKQNDLDKLFGKFASMDPKDNDRDKFMKKDDKKSQSKGNNKNKILSQDKTDK